MHWAYKPNYRLNIIINNKCTTADDLIYKFYYETLEDCSFFSIDYHEVEKIISNNPKLESNRKFLLRRIVKNSAERVQSFVLMNAEERYIKFVKDNPNLANRVPDKYIAHVLGITPVSLSRIRQRIALKK